MGTTGATSPPSRTTVASLGPMSSSRTRGLVAIAALACSIAAAAADGNLLDVAHNKGLFALGINVGRAGLDEALADPDADITLFGPTDAAFVSSALDAVGELFDGDSYELPGLQQTLLYHAVKGIYTSSDLSDGQSLETLEGAELKVRVDDSGVYVNDARVVEADIAATNGMLHIIDQVLEPPTTVLDVASNAGLNNLLAAV